MRRSVYYVVLALLVVSGPAQAIITPPCCVQPTPEARRIVGEIRDRSPTEPLAEREAWLRSVLARGGVDKYTLEAALDEACQTTCSVNLEVARISVGQVIREELDRLNSGARASSELATIEALNAPAFREDREKPDTRRTSPIEPRLQTLAAAATAPVFADEVIQELLRQPRATPPDRVASWLQRRLERADRRHLQALEAALARYCRTDCVHPLLPLAQSAVAHALAELDRADEQQSRYDQNRTAVVVGIVGASAALLGALIPTMFAVWQSRLQGQQLNRVLLELTRSLDVIERSRARPLNSRRSAQRARAKFR